MLPIADRGRGSNECEALRDLELRARREEYVSGECWISDVRLCRAEGDVRIASDLTWRGA